MGEHWLTVSGEASQEKVGVHFWQPARLVNKFSDLKLKPLIVVIIKYGKRFEIK